MDNKEWTKHDISHVLISERPEDRVLLNLEIDMDDSVRIQKLETLFRDYTVTITEKALTRKGLTELYAKDKIFLLPAIKQELGLSS